MSAVVPSEYIEVDLDAFRQVGVSHGCALEKYFGDFAALFICHAEKYGISDMPVPGEILDGHAKRACQYRASVGSGRLP